MARLSSLGGASLGDLLRRTARESWHDDVFGQAARLAFYHFLAIFPVILLLLIPLAHLSGAGVDMRNLLADSFRQFLPRDAASLIASVMQDLDANARSHSALLAIAAGSAVWAGINASWTMIAGLNTAYETRENRDWRTIALSAAGLGLAVVILVFAALLATHFIGRNLGPFSRLAQWAAIVAILMTSFALF